MKTRPRLIALFRSKYYELQPKYPQVGRFEAGRLSVSGGTVFYDFGLGPNAEFVFQDGKQVVEVHGEIYVQWKQLKGVDGALGLPVEDEKDYHGVDAEPGDRVSQFEHGRIVWREVLQRPETVVEGEDGNSVPPPESENAIGNEPAVMPASHEGDLDSSDDGVILQAFELQLPADGSLWRTIAGKADAFASLGVSSLWIPPPYKGANGPNANGYDVYDLYDLGEFDQKGTVRTKYGTKAELIESINALHKAGISVYADIVLNHRVGADEQDPWALVEEVDPKNRNKVVKGAYRERIWTRFKFPGRGGRYSSFQWNTLHFTGCEETKIGLSTIFEIFWLNFSGR